ncbi:hypothetical protein GCM10023205_71350 [Yinghuangia aomiensis]|uniref:Uncharacterized protein n=1 Tax=Yinghuangia aomiensis TaxID=676205 RepID=A0ABP9I6D5_9ACTN
MGYDDAAGVPPDADLLPPEVHIDALVEAQVRLVERQEVGRVQLAEDEVEFCRVPPKSCSRALARSGTGQALVEVVSGRSGAPRCRIGGGTEEGELAG